MEKRTRKKKSSLEAEIVKQGDSLLEEVDSRWELAPATNFQSTALTYLLRKALEQIELTDTGEERTVAQGLITDTITHARRGSPTALTIVFDRLEGKVPNTSVNVNATFTDDERIARVLDLIKRGRSKAVSSEPSADG